MAFTVAFLLYDDVTQLDFTGPAQILSRLPDAELSYIGKTSQPIRTDSGFSVVPTHVVADIKHCDVLCVPGGFGLTEVIRDPIYLSEVKRLAGLASYITSVCTGAFLLGAAGLLRGKRATTHWALIDLLNLVGAHPVRERVVRDGAVMTGGGVTAGIDFGLTIAAEVAGEAVARRIATSVEYDPAPPFGPGVLKQQSPELQDALIKAYSAHVEDMRRALSAQAPG